MRIVVVLVVVASLATVAMCDNPRKTTTSPPQPDDDASQVENVFCDYVVNTDTIHVPAFSDHHHRLLQLHVRTNIQVRITALTYTLILI